MTPRQLRYSLRRPEGWVALPALEALPDDAAIESFASGFEFRDVARERFFLDVRRSIEFAREQKRPNRRRWLYVPEQLTGTVVATMSIDVVRESGLTPDAALARLRETPAPAGTDVWSAEYALKTLAGRKAATAHEIIQVLPPDGETTQLNETYRVVVFTPELATVLEFSISTYDLGRFDDIVDYGDGVVDSIEFLPREVPA